MSDRKCKWCDTPIVEERASRPGPVKVFCSAPCRRRWHYHRPGFAESYEERCRWAQERWEWMVKWNGRERADEEAARFIAEAAKEIARFELDHLVPWKPNRRRAPRTVKRRG